MAAWTYQATHEMLNGRFPLALLFLSSLLSTAPLADQFCVNSRKHGPAGTGFWWPQGMGQQWEGLHLLELTNALIPICPSVPMPWALSFHRAQDWCLYSEGTPWRPEGHGCLGVQAEGKVCPEVKVGALGRGLERKFCTSCLLRPDCLLTAVMWKMGRLDMEPQKTEQAGRR